MLNKISRYITPLHKQFLTSTMNSKISVVILFVVSTLINQVSYSVIALSVYSWGIYCFIRVLVANELLYACIRNCFDMFYSCRLYCKISLQSLWSIIQLLVCKWKAYIQSILSHNSEVETDRAGCVIERRYKLSFVVSTAVLMENSSA